MNAGQWGDNAPQGSTISYPDAVAFLQMILATAMIQVSALFVMERWSSWMIQPELLPIKKLFGPTGMFGPSVLGNPSDPAHSLKFEIYAHLFLPPSGANVDTSTVKASEFPGVAPLNVAEFAQKWNMVAVNEDGLMQLLKETFPSFDAAAYEQNLAAWKASLPPVNPNPGGGKI